MSGQFDSRAMSYLNGQPHFYPTAWASYPAILFFFYKALSLIQCLEVRFQAIAMMNVLGGAFSVVIYYSLLMLIFPNLKQTNKVNSLFYLFYYPAISLHLTSLSENFYIPVLLFVVFLFVKIQKSGPPDFKLSIGLGFLHGLLVSVRSVFLLMIPLSLIGLWQNKRMNRNIWPYFLTLGFVIILFSAINQHFDPDRKFSITGNGGVNFALNWCHARKIGFTLADGRNFSFMPPGYREYHPSTELNFPEPFWHQSFYYSKGWDCLKANPNRLIENIGNIGNLFTGSVYPNILQGNELDDWGFRFWKIITIAFMFFFLTYPIVLRDRMGFWLFFSGIIISLFLAVYINNPGEFRHWIPYQFAVMAFAFPAIVEISIQFVKKLQSKVEINSRLLRLWQDVGLWCFVLFSCLMVTRYSLYSVEKIPRKKVENGLIQAALWSSQNFLLHPNLNFDIDLDSFVIGVKNEDKNTNLRLLVALKKVKKYFAYSDSISNQEFEPAKIYIDRATSLIQRQLEQDLMNFQISQTTSILDKKLDYPAAATALDSLLEDEPETVKDQMDKLGSFLLSHIDKYQTGRAIYICSRLFQYSKDLRYFECATQSFDKWISKVHGDLDIESIAITLEGLMKLSEIDDGMRISKLNEIKSHLATRLIAFQNKRDTKDDYRGGFDQGPFRTDSYVDALLTSVLTLYSEENSLSVSPSVYGIENLMRLMILPVSKVKPSIEFDGGVMSGQFERTLNLKNNAEALVAFFNYLSYSKKVR